MNAFRYLLAIIGITALTAAAIADEPPASYEVSVNKRVDGKWVTTGEKTTYKTFVEALRAVSKVNAAPDRMATYSKVETPKQESESLSETTWVEKLNGVDVFYRFAANGDFERFSQIMSDADRPGKICCRCNGTWKQDGIRVEIHSLSDPNDKQSSNLECFMSGSIDDDSIELIVTYVNQDDKKRGRFSAILKRVGER